MEKNCPCVLFLLLPLQSASPVPLFPCNGIIRSRGEQGNKCRALNPSRTIKGLTKVLVHLHNGPLLLWKHIKKSWFDCWELRVNSIPQITVRISIIFSISTVHAVPTTTNWKHVCGKHDQSVLLLAWGDAHLNKKQALRNLHFSMDASMGMLSAPSFHSSFKHTPKLQHFC